MAGGEPAWSKCPLGSAPAWLLRLRARLVAGFWAARHQVLELAAFKVAHCTALGHSGEPPLKKKGKGKKGKGKKGGFKRRAKQMGQSDP